MLHWLDGVRSLNVSFWKVFLKHPVTGALLMSLVILVMLRDLLLWLCMGDAYLDNED